MEFNIAFNTVFYISIFIIPGILLRRFYYHGEFHKEFSQGNLLERLMWTIFSSIIALLASALFFTIIRHFSGNLLPAISYATIKEVFDLLATNELPDGQRFKEIYSDFLFLIFGVYILSGVLGFLAHKIVVSISVHSPFSIFKFKNYWYYFFRGRIKNTKVEGKKYWYTEADVLVEQAGKSKMFSGKITDYYVDSAQNQLESIFLEDIRRYKFKENSSDYELKDIPGDIFCVPYNRVLNMNLTYVMQDKGIALWRNIIWWITQIIYYACVLVLFSIFWIEEVPGIDFGSIWYKGWFSLNSWAIVLIVRSAINSMLFMGSGLKKTLISKLIGIIFFSCQYLWIIGDRTPSSVIFISFFLLVFVVGIIGDGQSKDPNEEDDLGEAPDQYEMDFTTESENKEE